MKYVMPLFIVACVFLAGCEGSKLAVTPTQSLSETGPVSPTVSFQQVHPSKQTKLDQYVTAKIAHHVWKNDPENIHILDVRTPGEYVYVGHAAMARNIPVKFQTNQWDAEKSSFAIKPNPNFISQVRKYYQPNDTILVMCRSGHRSAGAINMMADAGYNNLYNIIDGFEGDTKKPGCGCADVGKRTVNGWKVAKLKWTYDLDPELMYLEK